MIRLEDAGVSKSENITHIANLSPAYVFDFENISHTVRTIITSGHRRIPVVTKEDNLVGILTYTDILDSLLRGLTRNTQVSTFMTRQVVYCDEKENIGSALQKMMISKRGGMPILKNTKLIGIVSERDFIRMISRKYFEMQVKEAMTYKPFYIAPNTSIKNCMKAMVNTHYRRLPIVEHKEVIGIITGIDILRFINNVNYNSVLLNENISQIMSTPVRYVTEHDDIADVVKIILEENIGGLPVINENNALKGIITERDIIKLL